MDKQDTPKKSGWFGKFDPFFLKRGQKALEAGKAKREKLYNHPPLNDMSDWFVSLPEDEQVALVKKLAPALRWWFVKSYDLKAKFGFYLAIAFMVPVVPVFILYVVNDMNDVWASEHLLGGYGIPLAFFFSIIAYYLHSYGEKAEKVGIIVHDPFAARILRSLYLGNKETTEEPAGEEPESTDQKQDEVS